MRSVRRRPSLWREETFSKLFRSRTPNIKPHDRGGLEKRSHFSSRMASDAREPQLLHVLTDARGRDFAALDDALGDAGGALVRRACVAVRGLSPVGVETARLLLASDVGEIVLLDEPRDATVTPSDIGATSVLAEEHLGKPRLRSVVDALNAPRFRPAHRVSPVVRAAGPNDAHWTGDETDVRDGVRDCSDEARTFRRRLTAPDALVSAWHVDTPTLADADHTIVSAVLGNGGTHVLAAAPGLFAFARAARRPRREGEDEDEDDSSDARAEEESASDSDEDARVLRSDVPSTGIWNERRFRDARLARAPVSLVESVVPADDDDATRLETKPKRRSLLFFVTVCDANAHGLREGDGVAFIDPLAEDTDDVARGRGAETRDPLTERARSRARAVKGVVRSIASPHAFAVSIDEAELLGGGHDAARLAGRYVRQRRRRDARERPPRVSAPFGNAFANAGGGTNKRKRESTRPNETSRRNEPTTTEATGGNAGNSRNVVAPTDVRGVSSFVYGRDAATVAPAVAAARVATAFLRLGRENKNDALPGVYDVYDDDADSSLAIDALRRGARVAFAPCVGVAAAVAAHETLKALARVQIPLAAGAPETGAWFAHDFLELDPAFSKHMDFSLKKEGKEGFGRKASAALPAKDTNVAYSVSDLLGAELVREAATREVAIVGASDRCRAFAETSAQIASARASSDPSTNDRSAFDRTRSNEVGDVRCFPTVASVPQTYADTQLDVLIVAGVEGFEARRAADASSTRHRFSLIDAGVENHAYSAYVAAVDRTAPWSVSGARDASDSPSFPSCVVGNFPHTFPHCAQWAREHFARLFVELPDVRAGWRAAWASRADGDEAGDVFVEEREPTKNETVRDRRETFFRTADGRSMLSPSSLDALAFALDASSDAAALRRFPATLPGADETENVLETKNAIEKKCVAWALALFERLFAEAPRDAVRANPPDSRTATGALFWSGTKRVPYALAFDVTDPHHATFVVAAATLRASALFDERKTPTRGSYSRDSLDDFAAARARMLETLLETARVTRNVTVRDETRVLKTHKKKTNDGAEVSVVKYEREEGDEKKKTGEDDAFSDDASRARRLADSVLDAFDDERAGSSRSSAQSSGGILRDPTAGPAFVAAAAACRARVFRVPVPREHELAAAATGARPATPAPAAFAAALAAAETYKLAQSTTAKRRSVTRSADGVVGNPPLPPAARRASESLPEGTGLSRCHFRCSYGSLGGHAHASASPAALETRVVRTSPTTPDLRFTAWDALTFDARDGVTLAGFLAMFRETVGLEPSTVARGPALLFADFMNLAKPETAARLTTPLAALFRDAVEENAASDATETRVALSVTACDARDEDVDVPEVWVRIR